MSLVLCLLLFQFTACVWSVLAQIKRVKTFNYDSGNEVKRGYIYIC